jgi:hypothetical protein
MFFLPPRSGGEGGEHCFSDANWVGGYFAALIEVLAPTLDPSPPLASARVGRGVRGLAKSYFGIGTGPMSFGTL